MDEEKLIQSAKEGDLNAFNCLVLAYQEQVFNLAYRMMNDDIVAQDVAQNTFINAYEHLRSFRGGSFRAWLYRIAVNNCYDELRRKKRKPVQPLTVKDVESGEEIDESLWLKDDDNLPEDFIMGKELESAIMRCIGKLRKKFQAVIILVDIQGMGYAEAARIVNVPLGTIRSRLARARLQIQKCLQHFQELLPEKYRFNNGSKR